MEWLLNFIRTLFGDWLNKPKPVSAEEKLGEARAELKARELGEQRVRDAQAEVGKVKDTPDENISDPDNRDLRG